MDHEPDESQHFLEPNDDLAHMLSSSMNSEPMKTNILPNVQSIEVNMNIIKNTPDNYEVEEHRFQSDINQDKMISIKNFTIDIKSFDINQLEYLTKNLAYLKVECERAQQITANLQNQLVSVKSIGKRLSEFCSTCRTLIISAMNIRQTTNTFTYRNFELLTLYSPDANFLTSNISNALLDQTETPSNENPNNTYEHRLEFSRSIMNLFKQATKLRLRIATLNEILVLPKNECFYEIEQSLNLPTNIFSKNSLYEIFLYEITTTSVKQDVYIRCIQGELSQNDIHITCTENAKHLLSQITYNACEKYSHIFDIEFKRVITSIDQLTIALPCSTVPDNNLQSMKSSSQLQQKLYIRCKRMIDPLVYIPAVLETYDGVSYAVFRITQSLSAISVEAVLYYPFEILQAVNDNSSSVYTNEHSPIFRIETVKHFFVRPPQVRIIPLNNELIRCMTVLKNEEQLLASSDLIEFEWFKESKSEGPISITIQLTRYFNLSNEIDDDLQKRRRKAQQKISIQRKKFEQEKYDEAGGSLATTPTSTNRLASPTVMSHLPSIAAILEQVKENHLIKPKFNINRDDHSSLISSKKSPFNWKLDGFQNDNAPIILLGYKNQKWKNCNNFATITRTEDKDIYIIHLTILLARMILIRCWPESTNEGKFDKLAENLWSLTSAKLFSCVLARDPSSVNSFGHYALMIVPIKDQRLAEDILYKRNYTEYIFNETIINDNNSKTRLSKVNQYQSYHSLTTRTLLSNENKYVQFCRSEGTYIRIIPMGNIDLHEKVDLSFRLYARYPVIIEFDIYPIDIYRQKTDDDFIGTLNIYEIDCHNNPTVESTSSTITAAAISSRTSSNSKDIDDIVDALPNDSSAQISFSVPETLSNAASSIGRVGFERLSARNLNEKNIICAICIRLPKTAFQLSSTQSIVTPMIVPKFFTTMIESLTEDKRELAEALHIHPSLMNSLLTSGISQKQLHSQSNLSLYRNSKTNLFKDNTTKFEQTKLENEPLFKWLKRQNAFKTNETKENIISALIHIGRVDLAYTFKIDNLK